MAATFSQSLRALSADRPRRSLATASIAAALLAGWLVWFFEAPITVVEVAEAARVEVERSTFNVESPVAGHVKQIRAEIGREVEAGEVLVVLDAELELRKLVEERAKLDKLTPELEAVLREMRAEEKAAKDTQVAGAAAVAEERARKAEADHRAELAEEEAKRATTMFDAGAVPEIDLLRARSEALGQKAAVKALSLGVDRIAGEQKARESEAESRIERLRRDAASIQGERAATEASIRVLEEAVEKRSIRAPARGRIGEVAALRPSAWVEEGEKLCSIIPEGELHIVAEFPPAAALGRVHPGQRARMRLDGFPWTRFGVVGAKVAKIASEARDGRIRVELDIERDEPLNVPLQHGLPGALEVDVEIATPARLALAAVGKALGRGGPTRR